MNRIETTINGHVWTLRHVPGLDAPVFTPDGAPASLRPALTVADDLAHAGPFQDWLEAMWAGPVQVLDAPIRRMAADTYLTPHEEGA